MLYYLTERSNQMKKSEVIKMLQKIDGDFDVIFRSGRDGYDDVRHVSVSPIIRDYYEGNINGDHELFENSRYYNDDGIETPRPLTTAIFFF